MLILFSCPVMSDSFQPHGLQHTRSSYPSPSLEVCPCSCPLYQWCHPAISSSHTLFFFCPQSFPASETFPMSQLFTSDDQNTGVSASASLLPTRIPGWFPLELIGLISLLSKRLSILQRHSLKASVLQCSSFFMFQLSQLNVITEKNIALIIQTFVGRVTSLLFNTLSWCVIFPAKKQTSSYFVAIVTIHSDFRPPKEEMSLLPPFSPLCAMR